MLSYASTKYARVMARHSNESVYEYRYHYPGSVTFGQLFGRNKLNKTSLEMKAMAQKAGGDMFANEEWVNHADESFLMWKPNMFPFSTVWTESDRKVNAALIQMWTDFAMHGDPTPDGSPITGDKWLPVKGGADSQHLEFTAAGPTMKIDSEEFRKRIEFWESKSACFATDEGLSKQSFRHRF